ncbi:MAG: gamma-glutamyltransferase, partial [bacterium]
MPRAGQFLRRAAAAALLFSCAAAALAQPIGQPEAATGTLDKRALDATRQLVVAANPYAADAGLEILRAGGSAVDAAVAVQLVLGLVEPQSSGLGGGGFLLHWSARERRVRSYDGRETAPAAAGEDRFVEPSGRTTPFFDAVVSGRSVGVPGLPRLHGLLARDKFLRADAAARALYYRDDGTPQPVGTRIANPAYAATLRAIAAQGADAFYSGPIAAAVVRAVHAAPRPGDMTLDDLAGYRAIERAPVCGNYGKRRVCGMGPPSAGAVVVL